jgi:hypothetical protein
MSEQAKPAEKLQAPIAQELVPYLRQYLHNDGSGLVFAYEKAGVDRLVALLQSRVAESARIESEQLDDAALADILRAEFDLLPESSPAPIAMRAARAVQRALTCAANQKGGDE